MEEKRKYYWIIYALLPLSYAFKNLYSSAASLAVLPYYYGAAGLDISQLGLGSVILGHAFLAITSCILCVAAIYVLDMFLRRNMRAFMPTRDFIVSVSYYVIIANAVLGVIGLVYYINPLIFAFGYDVINLLVYAVTFAVMFFNMQKVIPEYMVARVFGTLAVPVITFLAVFFAMRLMSL